MKKLKDEKTPLHIYIFNAFHLFPNKSGRDTGRTFEINLTKPNKLYFQLY